MRSLALAGAALLVAGLVGCSGLTPAPNQPEGQGEPSTAAPEPAAEGGACGGLTTEHLVGIFGVDLAGPAPSTSNSDQNGITWTSTGCDWEDEDALEVDLDISQGADFPDGTVTCIEPVGVGDVTEVSGIGSQAWWKFDDFNEVEGKLRVCTDDRLVELAVDAETGSMTSDELLEKAQTAARIVVG